MSSVELETAIPAIERLQTQALDGATTAIGQTSVLLG
jgi:hypothetical protein